MRIIFFLCLLVSNAFWGQIAFYKSFCGEGYDFGTSVVQLEDSSYVVTGSSSSFGNSSDAFILHIDSVGNFIESKSFGGSEADVASSILFKKNVGYFLVGKTLTNTNGAFDGWVVHLDESFNEIWQKNYGGLGWDVFNEAVIQDDATLILSGQSNSFSDGDMQNWSMKINSLGDVSWMKYWGNDKDDNIKTLVKLSDTSVVVAGQMSYQDSMKAMVTCLDSRTGEITWERLLGNTKGAAFNDVIFFNDSIFLVGEYTRTDTMTTSGNLAILNLDGEIIRYAEDITLNSVNSCIARNVNDNFNYLAYSIWGQSYNYPDNKKDLLLGKYTNNLYWLPTAYNLSNPGTDEANQVVPTSDGGYLLVGSNEYLGQGGGNIIVCKIGKSDVFPAIDIHPFGDPLLGVESLELVNQMRLWPNPSSDYVIVSGAQKYPQLRYEIVDFNGQMITADVVRESTIDVTKLSSSLYFISLFDGANFLGKYKLEILNK